VEEEEEEEEEDAYRTFDILKLRSRCCVDDAATSFSFSFSSILASTPVNQCSATSEKRFSLFVPALEVTSVGSVFETFFLTCVDEEDVFVDVVVVDDDKSLPKKE
jgi:hypothetical protein